VSESLKLKVGALNLTPLHELTSRKLVRQYLPALWLSLLILYILAGTPITPFHGDEPTQIYMTRDYAAQFIQGADWSIYGYSDTPTVPALQELRLLNGTINKTTMGLAWHLAGFQPQDINEQWDWGADWNYNQQNGHAPTPELLLTARWPSALFLAAGVVIMFALGWYAGDSWTAYLASAYYALSPVLLLNGRRAMMEGSMTFFSLLTVLAGVWVLKMLFPVGLRRASTLLPTKSQNIYTSWLPLLVLGIAAGFALSSKHNSLFTVAIVFGVCLVYAIRTRRVTEGNAKPLSLLLLATTSAGLTFYALNPAWWGEPLRRAGQVLELRQSLLDMQTAVFGGYADFGERAAGFFRQVFIALPQYYEQEQWAGYIGDQISRYEVSPWRGVSMAGSTVGGLLLLGLCVYGLWMLIRHWRDPVKLVLALWALTMLLSTLVLTPLEWQRYYLPAYPAVGLLAAVGVRQIFCIKTVGARRALPLPKPNP
jgi:hypothetical protein